MKFFGVILASALFISAGVSSERCKVVHTTTSILKCGDKVIVKEGASIAAFNECTTEGTDFKLDEMLCVMEKLGVLTNGSVSASNLEELFEPHFQEHSPALAAGLMQCFQAISADNAANDQYGPVECSAKVFGDVCGHKSCDWIRNLSDDPEISRRNEF